MFKIFGNLIDRITQYTVKMKLLEYSIDSNIQIIIIS